MNNKNNFIKSVNHTRLGKLEFADMVKTLSSIIEKHNPEALNITWATTLLAQQKDNISALEVKHQKHPISPQIVALRAHRDSLFGSLSSMIDVVERAKLSTQQEAYISAGTFLKRILNGFSSSNEKQKRERTDQLFATIDAKEDIKAAFAVLECDSVLEALRKVADELLAKDDLRASNIAQRQQARTRELRREIWVALQRVFDAIELAMAQYPEVDYSALVDELNVRIVEYRSLVKGRITRSGKSEESESEPILSVLEADKKTATKSDTKVTVLGEDSNKML